MLLRMCTGVVRPQLAVLEDRLGRLQALAEAGPEHAADLAQVRALLPTACYALHHASASAPALAPHHNWQEPTSPTNQSTALPLPGPVACVLWPFGQPCEQLCCTLCCV